MAQRSGLTVGGLAKAAWPLAVLAFLVNGTVVAVALQAVNVPGDTEMLDFPVLVFASMGPVLGNAIGFLAAYRRPRRASLVGFVTPGLLITAGFLYVAVVEFGDHDDVGVLVTSALVTVLPTAVAIAGLLRRRDQLIGAAGEPTAGSSVAAATPGTADIGSTGEWHLGDLPGPRAGHEPTAPPPPDDRAGPADRGSAARTATWDLRTIRAAFDASTDEADASTDEADASTSGQGGASRRPSVGLPPSPLETGEATSSSPHTASEPAPDDGRRQQGGEPFDEGT